VRISPLFKGTPRAVPDIRKALQWFYSQPTKTVQYWNALMRAFMKEYYSPGKTQSLHNRIATFAQYPTKTILEAFERFN
jgi:hypothetical protein